MLAESVMLTSTSGHVNFARFLPPYPTNQYCSVSSALCTVRHERNAHRKLLSAFRLSTPLLCVAREAKELVFRWRRP